MQIACPHCAAHYLLDEKLLPSAGAPVQCTRCSHVFTAKPEPKDGVLSAEEGSRKPRSTPVFGTPLPSAQEPVAPQNLPAFSELFRGAAFRAPVPASQPAAPPNSSTIMFALPSAEKPVETTGASRGATMMFSQPAPVQGSEASAPAPPSSNGATMMFGQPVAEPAAPVLPAPQGGATMMFALPSAEKAAAPVGASRGATMMFSQPVSAQHVSSEGSAPAPSSSARGATMMFSQPASEPPAPSPVRGSGTMVFGPTPTEEGARAAPARKNATMMFPSAGQAFSQAPGEPAPSGRSAGNLMFNSDGVAAPVGVASPRSHSGASNPAASSGRSKSWLLWVSLAVVAGAIAFFFLRNAAPPLPPEAMAECDEAMAGLRRDDAESIAKSVRRLQTLVQSHPTFALARSQLTVALALQLDDFRVELGRLDEVRRTLERKRDALEKAQAPADWLSRVNVLKDEVIASQRARTPVARQYTLVEASLTEALQGLVALVPAEGDTATVEAQLLGQAYVAAVKGEDAALGFAEGLKRANPSGPESYVVYAEYVLNAKAPPESLARAAEDLEAVRRKDSSAVRPFVLGARIALQQRSLEEAKTLLESALFLSRKHELSQRLLDWTQASLQRSQAEP